MERSISPDPPALWQASAVRIEAAQVTRFTRWIEQRTNRSFPDYESLWEWSTTELAAFWECVWDYFAVPGGGDRGPMLSGDQMPAIEWGPGRTVNFVDMVFMHLALPSPAIIHDGETSGVGEISWIELSQQVMAVAALLRAGGVGKGDRVVAYLPNIPQAVVAFLATASLGAIWSVCSPDMGVDSVLQRFQQLEPAALICADGYRYAGQSHSRVVAAQTLWASLQSLRCLIWVPLIGSGELTVEQGAPPVIGWPTDFEEHSEFHAEVVPFSHPLWIVFSSGTTGLPKAIVHTHGGIILNGLVQSAIHADLGAGDRAFWLCSTNWIVWNALVCALLVGATICLHDGSVSGPKGAYDWGLLWRYIAEHRVNYFGSGAAFYLSVMRAQARPAGAGGLKDLRTLASTGSPLPAETFPWLLGAVGSHVWITSVCGGTDIAGSFLMGVPTLPVYAGELQCRALGAAVEVYDPDGHPTIGHMGELVCERPLPSMPLKFWQDPGNKRYFESYFSEFRDSSGRAVWRHGDWMTLVPHAGATGAIVYGRSDATINRHGIRIGTAEYYRVIEAIPGVVDSLILDLEFLGRPSHLAAFVVLEPDLALTDARASAIKSALRAALSPRHVPDEIIQVDAIPRTQSGKKLEVPLRKLLLGMHAEQVLQREAVANPESLDFFIQLSSERTRKGDTVSSALSSTTIST
jgi:acetoacetyl-CoA synthetase